jgi:hypothetical protein
MPPPRSAAEQARRVQVRQRFIQHFERVTRNVSQTAAIRVIPGQVGYRAGSPREEVQEEPRGYRGRAAPARQGTPEDPQAP